MERSNSHLPKKRSLTQKERKKFEKILQSTDPFLLAKIEYEVVDFVNTRRSDTGKSSSKIYAKDKKALGAIVAKTDALIDMVGDLPYQIVGMIVIEYLRGDKEPEKGLPDFEKFKHAVLEVQSKINIKKGVKKNEDIHCLAYSLASYLRVVQAYGLPESENGILGQCVRQALTIADGRPYRESVKVYVESAIDALSRSGIDPLNPPTPIEL